MFDLFRRDKKRRVQVRRQPHMKKLKVETLEDRRLLDSTPWFVATGIVGPPSHEVYVATSVQERNDGRVETKETQGTENESDSIVLDFEILEENVYNSEASPDKYIIDNQEYSRITQLFPQKIVFNENESYVNEEILNNGNSSVKFNSTNDFSILSTASGGSGGGSGGSSTVYDLEITTTTSSSISSLESASCVNPLLESRSLSNGGISLEGMDYLTITIPALPYGYQADLTFTGTAQLGVDYDVLVANSGSSFTLTSTRAFQYSGGSHTIYIIPLNDSTPEQTAETIVATLGTPYFPGSGGESYPQVTFNEITMQATATIVDDDQWEVNVVATDSTATERLPNVVQDYGYYTFSRAHCNESVNGDLNYAITVDFNVYVKTSADYYCALKSIDYLLSVTKLNENDEREYLTNLQYLGSTVTQTADDGKTFFFYRYRGTIPADKTSASLRLEAFFDWEDEGELLFDFEGNPTEQLGEFVRLTVVDADWGGKTENWNALGSSLTAEVEIKDGALCKIRTDSNSDGVINSTDDNTPVRYLTPNKDDDNENGTVDSLELPVDANIPRNRTSNNNSITVENENDLAETKVFTWIDSLTPIVSNETIEVDVYLASTNSLSVWTASSKGKRIHYGEDSDNDGRKDYETTIATLSSNTLTYSNTYYVEALSEVNTSTLSLNTDVIGSTNDASDCMQYTIVNVICTDMAFNHDPYANTDGAVNLRKDGNANTEIIAPEWSLGSDSLVLGNDGNKNQRVVLYLANQTVDVYARLKTTSLPEGTIVKVKATGKNKDTGEALSIGNLQEQILVVQQNGWLLPATPQDSTQVKTINGVDYFVKFNASGTTGTEINYEKAVFEWEGVQIAGTATGSNCAVEGFNVTNAIGLYTILEDPSSAVTIEHDADSYQIALHNSGGTPNSNTSPSVIYGGTTTISVTLNNNANTVISSSLGTTVATISSHDVSTTITIIGGTTTTENGITTITDPSSITVETIESGVITTRSIAINNGITTINSFNASVCTSPWDTTDNSSVDDLKQPWVSALEFAVKTANARGNDVNALSTLTRYLHSNHGLVYETVDGESKFLTSSSKSLKIRLENYMDRNFTNYTADPETHEGIKLVNCYDQAAALTTFGRLLGIRVKYAHVEPFGYINSVNLVGIGNCNNPFFNNSENRGCDTPLVAENNLARTSFGNHAFTVYNDKVYDACGGPITGDSFSVYFTTLIDFNSNIQVNLLNSSISFPESVNDIQIDYSYFVSII